MLINKKNIPEANSLAKVLFNYLYLRNDVSNAEAVIGFGHFDEKIAQHCGELYSNGFCKFIIFTGGIGAGSNGLKKPEAREFFDRLQQKFPGIAKGKVILEDKSTNTAENIQFTLSLLEKKYGLILAPNKIKKLILVANAYRQRRVWLTCRKYLKEVELINSPPITDFENELSMFEQAGENFFFHLAEEIERIRFYPSKGFIESSEIPDKIIVTARLLKELIIHN